MHSTLLQAFAAYRWSHDFAESVNIKRLDAKLRFELRAHFLSPGLCAKQACFQTDVFLAAARSVQLLCKIQRVGWRAADVIRFKVF